MTEVNQPNVSALNARLIAVRKKKRVFDTVSLIMSAPIVLPLGIAISLLVRGVDGAPVLFRQERTGMNEAPFSILKFRTMDSGDGRNDDFIRITKLGNFLRRTSLDELPQLVNVLRGDMSLVGPRPLYPEYRPYYTDLEKARHAIRPGITGLSQISGRNALRWTSRLAKDIEYVRHASLRQDVKILMQTVKKAISRTEVASVPRDTGEPLNVERSYPRDSTFALRRFNLLDVSYRVEWLNDHRTRRHMQIPFRASEGAMVDWYHRVKQDPQRDDFVVYRRSDDQPVAMLGLKRDPGSASGLLYVFVDPFRVGEGIGTASMELILEWARSDSRYESVRLSVGADNPAAWTIYERLGFLRGADDNEYRRTYELDVSTGKGK